MRRAIYAFWRKAYEDNLTGLAAMVAYNLLLSLWPLALIALFVAGRVIQSDDLERSVVSDLQEVFPSAAESTLTDALRRVRTSSTTVGIVALVASVWVGASFWGSLDTAFCRIYHLPCRSWVRQKLFALSMLFVVLLFFAATLSVPAIQALLVARARDLPFGLSDVDDVMYGVSLMLSTIVLFAVLCALYWRVPKGSIPWRCVWPGALVATVAMGVVDYAFPLYLTNVSTLAALGPSVLFVLIALIWFYALAMIILGGAVVNELRFERAAAPSRASAPVQAPATPASAARN